MRIIATLILCFLPTYFMYGQPQKELDEHLNTYVKVLGLTGEQKNQFQILFQETGNGRSPNSGTQSQ
jgi:hypothetical protein